MVILLKFLLLLLCAILSGAILSGVISQNCNRCQGCCFITINSTALCKCDENCQIFGDCCGENSHSSSSPTSTTFILNDGVKLHCHSIFTNPDIEVMAENEAYLMVSSCPSSWVDPENTAIQSNCNTPTQSLPPVTDITTGLAFRNEYCAHCNRVTELVAWPSELVCSEIIYDLIITSTLSVAINSDPDILNRECSPCSFFPPNITYTGAVPPRSCIPRVETCLPNFKLEIEANRSIEEGNYTNLVGRCQSGPLDLVFSIVSGEVYRNVYCATCNADSGECFNLQLRDSSSHNQVCQAMSIQGGQAIPSFSFTITLSNLGNGQIAVSSSIDESTSISITCPEGEILIGAECRTTQCPEGYSRTGGRCSYVDSTSDLSSGSFQDLNYTLFNCSNPIVVSNESYIDLGNDIIVLKEVGLTVEVLEYDNLGRPIVCQQNNSAPYLNCTSALVVLNASDYTVLENGSIRFGGTVVEVGFRDEFGRPLICPDLIDSSLNNTLNGLLATLPGIQALTYIGCSLSVLGAVAVLLTYSIFSDLQTFPGLVLMNLCAPIFATNLLFIIGGPVIQYHPLKEICSTLAIVLHYFYLSQFSWMSIFSFEMTKTFYQARKLVQDSRQAKRKYLAIYLTIGWVLPLVISTITIIVNFTTEGLVLYGVNSQGQIAGCWINHYQSFIIAFVLPLVLSLSCNLILFIITTVLLCRAYRDQAKVDKSNISTMIRVWLAVFTITGLTWIFGFLALLEEVSWIWYLFVIFNSTQGFSIFLAFIFTKKILNLYKTLIAKKMKARFFISQETKLMGSTLRSSEDVSEEGNVQAVSVKLKSIATHKLELDGSVTKTGDEDTL